MSIHPDVPAEAEAEPDAEGREPRRHRAVVAVAVVALVVAALLAVPRPGAAIVGGDAVHVDEVPWQVALLDAEGQLCGGSIVAADRVVTAAHCIEGFDASELTVRAGVTDRRDEGGQDRAVVAAIAHPDYEDDGLADIAVLLLADPLELGGSVQAIGLADDATLAAAPSGLVSGWGAESEQDEVGPDVLRAGVVPLVDDPACAAALGASDAHDAATEACAGGTGVDSCYGDSGGPLAVSDDGEWRLAGVTSWGIECGGDTPGVYTEVPAFADWVAAVAPGGGGAEHTPSDDEGAEGDAADDEWAEDEWGEGDTFADDWADEGWSDDDWGEDGTFADDWADLWGAHGSFVDDGLGGVHAAPGPARVGAAHDLPD